MNRLLLAGCAAAAAVAGCGKTHDSHVTKTNPGALPASPGRIGGDQAHPWTGVWQGTIGTAPVRVCFGTEGDPDQGSYYYLRHLSLIALNAPYGANANPATQGWTERGASEKTKPPPHWTLSPGPGATLNGAWTGGGRIAPIRLVRAADSEAENADAPCAGKAFQGPRMVGSTVTRMTASLDGTTYEKVVANVGAHFDSTIETFALLGGGPGVARINAEAARVLPKSGGADVPDYLDCAMGAAGSNGENAEFAHTLVPGLITRHWVAADESTSGSCGGAHPTAEDAWHVWSLTNGDKVDPWTWFSSNAARNPPRDHPEVGATIEPALRRLLIAHWPRGDDDCADIGKTQLYWSVHPTRDGLAFWPDLPHVIFACSEDDVIPYSELKPLLNAGGRAAIALILEDLQTLPTRPKART